MNITEHEKGTMRLFAARTGAKDVVTIEGSVLGGYAMLDRNKDMVQNLAVSLLDAGTEKHDKDAIRSILSSRGASIHFSTGKDRTHFSAACLPEDVEAVLSLIAECLTESIFPAKELATQKKRTLAELDEAKTDTRTLAANEFSRLVYDPKHINYADSLPVTIGRVQKVERRDLQAFGKMLGNGGLIVAITGDIQPDAILTKAEKIFGRLREGTVEVPEKALNKATPNSKEVHVPIADKANVDFYIGARVPINRDHPEFLPLTILTDMLAGRGLSGGHLMRTIRERDGLTYGINGGLIGFNGLSDGALRIWATFSPATYEKAVEATKKEIQSFLKTGITEEALVAKKGQLTGKYAVGLATSGGLASTLHDIGVEGKPLSYIDEYPSLINAITVSDLKNAAKLVPWDALSIAAAGTFKK